MLNAIENSLSIYVLTEGCELPAVLTFSKHGKNLQEL